MNSLFWNDPDYDGRNDEEPEELEVVKEPTQTFAYGWTSSKNEQRKSA